ncbi:MAG: SDR family NAD(P)-dependent oxidoreductase [Bacteroidaceae bacterium]|nr:SDR family NAD(P)-dependent oxidoreductase [Bacteroidaceae bacterium]
MSQTYTIVTGAGGSIGQAITRALASEGRNVIMACRNIAKDSPVCEKINSQCPGNVRIMQLDLASLDSVAHFAQAIGNENIEIDALINNAGVMLKHHSTTQQGLETTVGVIFVGTYLLTHLLIPHIKQGGHITFTTSLTRFIGKVDRDFFNLTEQNYGRFKAYSRSKLATTLLTAHLAQELAPRGIHVNAGDPGVVDTGMIHMDAWFDPIADCLFRPIISNPQQGAVSALSASESNVSGHIFEKRRHHIIPLKWRNHPQWQWLREETERIIAPWR